MQDNYLIPYGVPGMKWGHRKYGSKLSDRQVKKYSKKQLNNRKTKNLAEKYYNENEKQINHKKKVAKIAIASGIAAVGTATIASIALSKDPGVITARQMVKEVAKHPIDWIKFKKGV